MIILYSSLCSKMLSLFHCRILILIYLICLFLSISYKLFKEFVIYTIVDEYDKHDGVIIHIGLIQLKN